MSLSHKASPITTTASHSRGATLPHYTSNEQHPLIPPPDYQSDSPSACSAQLSRYLVQLIAYTFQANFGQLNNLLNPGRRISSGQYFISILADDEKAELKRLAHSISELQLMAIRRRWKTTLKRERRVILNSVVRPAEELGLWPPYILDMLSTYAEHECHNSKRNFTVVGRYLSKPRPRPRCNLSFIKALLGFTSKDAVRVGNGNKKVEDSLREHLKIINAISSNAEVRNILGRALSNFIAQINHRTTPGSWPANGPCLDGYFEVYNLLNPKWKR